MSSPTTERAAHDPRAPRRLLAVLRGRSTSRPSSAGGRSSGAATRCPRARRRRSGGPQSRAAAQLDSALRASSSAPSDLPQCPRRPATARRRRVLTGPAPVALRSAAMFAAPVSGTTGSPCPRVRLSCRASLVVTIAIGTSSRPQSPRYPRERVGDRWRRRRLGPGRAGRRPGRRAGAVRRVLPRRLARSPTSTSSPPRPRSSWPQATGLRRLAGPGPGPRHRPRRAGSTPTWLVPAPAAAAHRQARRPPGRSAVPASVTPRVAGAEVGVLLGWMSTRVLGQYDLLVIEDEDARRPGPRLLRRAQRPRPREALRLPARASSGCGWRCTRSPTGRSSPASLAARALPRRSSSRCSTSVDPDPKRFLDALGRAGRRRAQRRKPARRRRARGAARHARAARRRSTRSAGLMSLLEGHGDVTMDRAGADHIPSAERFGRVLRERRASAKPVATAAPAAHRARGQDATSTSRASAFIDAVEGAAADRSCSTGLGGARACRRIAEIREPAAWLDARRGLADRAAV